MPRKRRQVISEIEEILDYIQQRSAGFMDCMGEIDTREEAERIFDLVRDAGVTQ